MPKDPPPERPDPDPNVAADDAVARLTRRDTEDLGKEILNRRKGSKVKRDKRKKDGEQPR